METTSKACSGVLRGGETCLLGLFLCWMIRPRSLITRIVLLVGVKEVSQGMSTLSLPVSPVFCPHWPNQGHVTQSAVMKPSIGLWNYNIIADGIVSLVSCCSLVDASVWIWFINASSSTSSSFIRSSVPSTLSPKIFFNNDSIFSKLSNSNWSINQRTTTDQTHYVISYNIMIL